MEKEVKCKNCVKQFYCKQEICNGMIKFSQTRGYGIPERKENGK